MGQLKLEDDVTFTDGTVLSSIGAGTSGTSMRTIGILDTLSAEVGNVGAGEDVLHTYTLPANSFSVTGKIVRWTFWGGYANNAAAKTHKIYFGSLVNTISLTVNQEDHWNGTLWAIRTGSNTQRVFGEFWQHGTTSQHTHFPANLTETDTAGIVMKITGEATSNDDIVISGSIIEFLN